MTYELWWRDSLNVTAVFETEHSALESLRVALAEQGPGHVADFGLERVARSGKRCIVAAGPQLLALVSGSTSSSREIDTRHRAAS